MIRILEDNDPRKKGEREMILILEYKKKYSDIDEAISNFTFGKDLVVIDNLPFGWEELRTPSQLEDYLETSSPYDELLAYDSAFKDYIGRFNRNRI